MPGLLMKSGHFFSGKGIRPRQSSRGRIPFFSMRYAVYWPLAAAAFAPRQLARSTGMSAVSAMSSLRE